MVRAVKCELRASPTIFQPRKVLRPDDCNIEQRRDIREAGAHEADRCFYSNPNESIDSAPYGIKVNLAKYFRDAI
jgi:hypothetical protein